MASEEISSRLKAARERRGFQTAREASSYLGVPYGTYSGHESGTRGIKRDDIARYAKSFGVSPEWLAFGADAPLSSQTTPIVGFVGAGQALYAIDDGPYEFAPAPPNATAKTIGVKVRGDSMAGRADDGDLIFYDDRRDPPTPDLIGRLCVVGLPDGRVLVKKLLPGPDGLFHLYSTNAEPMLNQQVDWAARVTAIVPR